MNKNAVDLSKRVGSFNDEVIRFAENCSDEDWKNICMPEEWPVGVTARHIGAGHYVALALAKMILKGEALPQTTADEITRRANEHAREHAGCSKPEVLGVLRESGREVVDFLSSIDDSQIGKTGYLPLMRKDISVGKLLEIIILVSAGQHFESMKKAVKK